MNKLHVRVSFLYPFRVLPWRKRNQRATDPVYRRGGSFARWHLIDKERGRPYITGTLLRSALFAELEKIMLLHDYPYDCCDGMDRTLGSAGPTFLRKRPGYAAFKDPCGKCPLCLIMGRADPIRGRQKIKGDMDAWSVHFSNLVESTKRKFKWKETAVKRVVNRVDFATGKARDYMDIREIHPEICSRFEGKISINIADETMVGQIKAITAAGLARIHVLAGSICRIDVIEDKHDNLIKTFLNTGGALKSTEPGTFDSVETYDLQGLDRLAELISETLPEKGRQQQLRRLADVVRELRRFTPDIVRELPRIDIDDKKRTRNESPHPEFIGESPETEVASQIPIDGKKATSWDRRPAKGKSTLRQILAREARHIPPGLWRRLCEELGRALRALSRKNQPGIGALPRLLGEARYYGLSRTGKDGYGEVVLNKKAFPRLQWILTGDLRAATPFFFGRESARDAGNAEILLGRDGSYRLPRSVIRGALRRDLRHVAGDACNMPIGGEMCGCVVCRIMRRVVIEDSVVNYKEPPEMRYRIRLNGRTGAVEEGALFDTETGLQGMTFPFRLHVETRDPSLDPRLWRVLDYWQRERAFLGGNIGIGLGGFCLENLRLHLLNLSKKEEHEIYLLSRGFKGCTPDILEKRIPGNRKYDWEYARGRSDAPVFDLPWERLEYAIEIVSPLISRDPVGAMLDKRITDAIMLRKTVLLPGEKEGDPPVAESRNIIKGESIRGILRSAAARNEGLDDQDHENCHCTLCGLFGGVHQQGKLRFEDLEVQGRIAERKMDHVAIDRFTGGGVDKMKFDEHPLPGSPNLPLLLKGALWIKTNLEVEEKKALQESFSDLGSGSLSLGGLGAIGYGKIGRLVLLRKPDWVELPRGKNSETPSHGRFNLNHGVDSPLKDEHIYHPHYFIKPGKREVARETRLVSHGKKVADGGSDDLVSGEIKCLLTTRGPIFIPDANDEDYFLMKKEHPGHKSNGFFRINGEIAIPGSSIRGVVSSVYETLTHSCFRIMNERKRLSWRMSADPTELNEFSPGRVVKENGGWKIEEMEWLFRRNNKGETTRIPLRVPLYDSLNLLKGKKPTRASALINRTAPGLKEMLSKYDSAKIHLTPFYPLHRRPHQVDEIVIKLRGGNRKGYLKITGPNKIEVKKLDETNAVVKSGKVPGEWSEVIHNKVESETIRKFGGWRKREKTTHTPFFEIQIGGYVYTMTKRCEILFFEKKVKSDPFPIPETTESRYLQLLKEYEENAERNEIPFVFRTILPKNGLNHGDLVYFRHKNGKVADIAPVRISRIVDDRPIGRRFPDGNDSLLPCTQACLEDCERCEELCEKVNDYFHPHPKGLCPACHLFGTPYYKGRVRFEIAWLKGDAPIWHLPSYDGKPSNGGPLTLPLLERPRPTWAMPDKKSEIPGRKFYVHHPWSVDKIGNKIELLIITDETMEKLKKDEAAISDDIIARLKTLKDVGYKSEDALVYDLEKTLGETRALECTSSIVKHVKRITTADKNNRTIEPLGEGNRFTFSVRFHNLRDWELGLLIYSLELEDDLGHKLGMGKALGFGSAQIAVEGVAFEKEGYRHVDKPTFVEKGFEKLGIEKDEKGRFNFAGNEHIERLRELLWIPPEASMADVRYPDLKSEEEGIPGYTDFIKEKNPKTGKSNPAFLTTEKRLAILQAPWIPWHKRRKDVIKEIGEDEIYTSLLPYALQKVEIENFLCIKKITIDPLPDDAQWLFFLGNNGHGKTAFLQALTIGVHGVNNAGDILENQLESYRISVQLKEGKKVVKRDVEWTPGKHISSALNPPAYYFAYGPSRLDIQGGMTVEDQIRDIKPDKSMLYQKGALMNIETWIKDEKLKEPVNSRAGVRLSNVLKLFETLIPNVSEIKLEADKIIYIEHGHPSLLPQTASGHKSVLAMVGDMLIRLFRLQPHEVDPKKLSGIVVIDELDIHIHPVWLRKLPGMLSDLFPRVQFICSTHSPLPLLGAPNGSKFFVVARDEENGTTITDPGVDVTTLHPNALLTSPLFNFKELFSDHLEDLERLDPEKDYQDIVRRRLLDELIEKRSGEKQVFPQEWFDE